MGWLQSIVCLTHSQFAGLPGLPGLPVCRGNAHFCWVFLRVCTDNACCPGINAHFFANFSAEYCVFYG